MGQPDASGVGGDRRSIAQAVVVLNRSKKVIEFYEGFRSSTVQNWIGVSESVAQQHQALHLALDMCYQSREVMLQDPSVINLINALETAVLANVDIMEKVTEFLADLETLSKRMDNLQ